MERGITLFRQCRADARAKQEILCYIRAGATRHDIQQTLLARDKDALYHYADGMKRDMHNSVTCWARLHLERLMTRSFDDRYATLIGRALDTVEFLRKRIRSDDLLIELLQTEPLVRWPAFARRMYYFEDFTGTSLH